MGNTAETRRQIFAAGEVDTSATRSLKGAGDERGKCRPGGETEAVFLRTTEAWWAQDRNRQTKTENDGRKARHGTGNREGVKG